MGNPHAILTVDAVDTIATDKFGLEISSHAHFPEGVNVGFMQIMNKDHIRLRTFERGAGETHACGSNACAAAAAGIINGWLTQPVNVEFRYGSLKIEWEGDNHPLHMTGPAARVFNGTLP
jgi:diaminopimelate epimerase